MKRAATFLIAVHLVLACLHAPATAQDQGLPGPEQSWLDGLVGAKFTSSSGANGFSIKSRNYQVFADEVVPVLERADELTEAERKALQEVVVFEVPADGWVNNYAVSKGTYTVGLSSGPNNLRLVTRDADGEVVDIDGWYLSEGSDFRPGGAVILSSRRLVTARLSWGDITFQWKYLRRADHDDRIGAVTPFTSGSVVIHSDLPEEAGIQRIAELAAKAVTVNDDLFGRPFPEGEKYELYLLRGAESFDAIDSMLTDGHFKDNGAMTAWMTGLSYVQWWGHWGEDYHLSSDVLEVVIHELHHQYSFRAFPALRYAPRWLKEALAEYAAQQGMEKAAPAEAETYKRRRMAEIKFYLEAGMAPGAIDLVTDLSWSHLSAYYATMWGIGRQLARQPGDMRALVEKASECERMWVSLRTVQREFDERYPPMSELLSEVAKEAEKSGGGFIRNFGCVDRHEGEVQVNSRLGKGAYGLFDRRIDNNRQKLSCEFRWDDRTAPQVDFYFAFIKSAKTEQFLKLALLPDSVALFECVDGDWERLASLSYETSLEVMKDDEPVWHGIEIDFNALQERITMTMDNGRWAEIKLPRYYSVRDTYSGIGCYDGVAWFRNLELE